MNTPTNKKFLFVIVVFLASFFIVLSGIYLVTITSPSIEKATVKYVIDGDTFVVYINNEERKIRLLGVNSPESVNPNKSLNTQEGEKASLYLKSILPPCSTVYLETDPYQPLVDKYGRLLRYVWLQPDKNDNDNLVNYLIIKNGYAEMNFYGNDASLYKGRLIQAKDEKNR